MNDLIVSEDIVPIGEFKKQTSRLLRRVKEEGQPLLITQNGRPIGVVIPPEEYDRIKARDRVVAAAEEGLRQSEAVQVLTNEDVDRKSESGCTRGNA